MMISPESIRAARSVTVFSVAGPAGTMIQTARGALSFAIKSSSKAAPVAPSPASASTFAALTSQTTHSCPPRIRRRTMFAPMRPRPIIPICITKFPLYEFSVKLCVSSQVSVVNDSRTSLTTEAEEASHRSTEEKSDQSLLDCRLQLSQSGINIRTQMNAQSPASTLSQHGKVSARLRGFHEPKTIFLTRHRQIVRIVTGYLQENSRVRSALVRLSRRMKKTRPEAETGGRAACIKYRFPRRLQQPP